MFELVPVISEDRNYWLVRTNGGKYYREYLDNNFIGINWNEILVNDIHTLSYNKLSEKIKECYPDKIKPGRAASQLRIFSNQIKKGDIVVITSYSSSKFAVGEIEENDPYEENILEQELIDNPKKCPYRKRKKVNWLRKDIPKMNVDMPMFRLLQHARNTINDANLYSGTIEGLVHDFYIKGDESQITLRITEEENINATAFFSLGAEVLELVAEFGEYSNSINFDTTKISTKVNVNSKGNFKFVGPAIVIMAAGIIVNVCLTGGGFKAPLPEKMGGGEIDAHLEHGLIHEITEFLDHKQAREQKEVLLKKYMDTVKLESPEELQKLMESVTVEENQEIQENEVKQENSDANSTKEK